MCPGESVHKQTRLQSPAALGLSSPLQVVDKKELLEHSPLQVKNHPYDPPANFLFTPCKGIKWDS